MKKKMERKRWIEGKTAKGNSILKRIQDKKTGMKYGHPLKNKNYTQLLMLLLKDKLTKRQILGTNFLGESVFKNRFLGSKHKPIVIGKEEISKEEREGMGSKKDSKIRYYLDFNKVKEYINALLSNRIRNDYKKEKNNIEDLKKELVVIDKQITDDWKSLEKDKKKEDKREINGLTKEIGKLKKKRNNIRYTERNKRELYTNQIRQKNKRIREIQSPKPIERIESLDDYELLKLIKKKGYNKLMSIFEAKKARVIEKTKIKEIDIEAEEVTGRERELIKKEIGYSDKKLLERYKWQWGKYDRIIRNLKSGEIITNAYEVAKGDFNRKYKPVIDRLDNGKIVKGLESKHYQRDEDIADGKVRIAYLSIYKNENVLGDSFSEHTLDTFKEYIDLISADEIKKNELSFQDSILSFLYSIGTNYGGYTFKGDHDVMEEINNIIHTGEAVCAVYDEKEFKYQEKLNIISKALFSKLIDNVEDECSEEMEYIGERR